MSAPENHNGDGTPLFVSRFDNKVDEKRRIQIPSSWRRGQSGVRYILVPVPKRAWRPACMVAMPPQKFMNLVQEVRQMRFSDDRADTLRRLLATRATEVETDSAGRICLPEDVARAVDIKDRVILAGMIDCFEIWSPDRYAQMESGDDERSAEAFSMI
ncbi:MAG: division/cell wall cluster transcriptional repressor MraZ [Limisphaerales bacterium]